MHKKKLRLGELDGPAQAAGLLARAKVATGICLVALLGCSSPNGSSGPEQSQRTARAEPPLVSGLELDELVRQSDEPVLVEFGVDFGCGRCNDMRPHVARLVSEFQGRVQVVRVDFNANRELAVRSGADVCPSYVLFHDGSPVVTRRYPTSADLLAADLAAVASTRPDRFAPSAAEVRTDRNSSSVLKQ